MRWVSGANPPTVGNPTVFQITAVVTNPSGAIGDITFSQPSNLVTVNVPGGDVVYAGGATISAGTLVSQPSLGAGGDVRWDPGTLSPGGSELLTYQITVTPSAPGILNVTGAAGSANGTRARFVDETGNTTQSRATFDFGELCELQVGTSLLTHVIISHFDVFRDAGRIVVRFKTRSESGTAGFHLTRFDTRTGRWSRVNEKLVPGLIDAPQGGTYSIVDVGAPADEDELTYALFEVNRRGRKKLLGIYPRRVAAAPPATIGGQIQARTARESAAKHIRRPHARRRTRSDRSKRKKSHPRHVQAARGPSEVVKIVIEQTGVTYVSAESIASALGLDVFLVRSRIRSYFFDLRHRGNRVSWQADDDGGGFYFFAEGIDSQYTTENVYWLQHGKGRSVRPTKKSRTPGSTGRQSFRSRTHFEEDLLAILVLPLDAQTDYWAWRVLVAGDPSQGTSRFSFDVPGLVDARDAVLAVELQGATDTGAAREHNVEVRVNGVVVGETVSQGLERVRVQFLVSPAPLFETGNELELKATLGADVSMSVLLVDSFDVEYERRLEAENGSLVFLSSARGGVSVSGFPSPEVKVWDISKPRSPRRLSATRVDPAEGAHIVHFIASREATAYVAFVKALARPPVRVEGTRFPRLRNRRFGADWICPASRGNKNGVTSG